MIKAPFNLCMECDEVITNPICSECLAERMKVMIQEHDQKLAQKISGHAMEGGSRCIFCGKGMTLCAHCFSKEVYEYLQDENPTLAREFANRFDFDLRRAIIEQEE